MATPWRWCGLHAPACRSSGYRDSNVWAAYALKGGDPRYGACRPLFDGLRCGKKTADASSLVAGEAVQVVRRATPPKALRRRRSTASPAPRQAPPRREERGPLALRAGVDAADNRRSGYTVRTAGVRRADEGGRAGRSGCAGMPPAHAVVPVDPALVAGEPPAAACKFGMAADATWERPRLRTPPCPPRPLAGRRAGRRPACALWPSLARLPFCPFPAPRGSGTGRAWALRAAR